MNKNLKTALVAALSLFGAGVLIWLCVSISVGFDYSKLSVSYGASPETVSEDGARSYETEHVDRDIGERGQSVTLDLSYANVAVSPSDDGQIHLSYDNTGESFFELNETETAITLTQKQKRQGLAGLILIGGGEKRTVYLSLPEGRSGVLSLNSASGDITVLDVVIGGEMKLYTVSGELTAEGCESAALNAGTVSGNVRIGAVKAGRIDAESVSGNIRIGGIERAIPLSLRNTSGSIYAENVLATELNVSSVSGRTGLKRVQGDKADCSSASGSVRLDGADFKELRFSSVSGSITGTVTGVWEDYTAFTDTVTGRNSLSAHRRRGERTLDLSSTSGSFDISFEV